MTNLRPATIFCDIDGTLVEHLGSAMNQVINEPAILPGVLEKFKEWDLKCYFIVLTTGRRESARKITEKQLRKLGINYNLLIMGLPNGPRIVINDLKPNSDESMAIAINVKRNMGLKGINL